MEDVTSQFNLGYADGVSTTNFNFMLRTCCNGTMSPSDALGGANPKNFNPDSITMEQLVKPASSQTGDAQDVNVVGNGNDTESPDPFDPVSLRINPENTGVAIKKVTTTIRCWKPDKQDFVRVRPGDEWRLDVMLLEEEGSDVSYLVSHSLHDELASECFPARLVLAVTRSNTPFLWRLKLPRSNGRVCRWGNSAMEAAKLAETKWVRVVSNQTTKCYDVFEATGINVEPQWPDDLEFKDILRICFKDRFIDSIDHPFVQRLRGKI